MGPSESSKAVSAGGTYPPRGQAAWMVAVLVGVTFTALLDRSIPALLVEPVRRDLGISDTQYSVIQGYAYSIFYCLAGFPVGRLVDRTNRRNLILIGIPCWSGATILCGLATDFWTLCLARMGVGASMALLAPAAYSIVADYFEPARRGRALAVYSLAFSIGAGLSFIVGGVILRAFAGSPHRGLPVISSLEPWQLVFVFAGLPGLLLAPLLMTTREPPRHGQVQAGGVSAREFFAYLRRHAGLFAPLYATYGVLAFVSYCILPWAPSFYLRKFGLPIEQTSTWIGMASLVGGLSGTLTAGLLSDRWASQARAKGGRFLVPLVSMVVNIPIMLAVPLVGHAELSLVLYTCSNFVSGLGVTSAAVTIQSVVPNQMRGRAMAIYQITIILLAGFSPTAVALVTDHVFHDDQALPLSLAVTPFSAAVVGVVAALFGLRGYERARQQGIAQ